MLPTTRQWRAIILATGLSSAFSASAAEDLLDQWYMQPRLSPQKQQLLDSRIDLQGISIGKHLDQRLNLEINLLSDQQVSRPEQQGILLDGRYYLGSDDSTFMPYIAGGIAKMKYNQPGLNLQPTTNIGLGFEHTIRNGTRIQADVRYFTDERHLLTTGVPLNDWTMSLGVSIPLTFDLFGRP